MRALIAYSDEGEGGRGGIDVKKLPLIGLIFGAIAALFAMRKKKAQPPEHDTTTGEA